MGVVGKLFVSENVFRYGRLDGVGLSGYRFVLAVLPYQEVAEYTYKASSTNSCS